MQNFIKSSGNIFADLELPDAKERLAKAELARKIDLILKRKKLTQVQAAKILDITQPEISNLLSGKLSGFSTDLLSKFHAALTQD